MIFIINDIFFPSCIKVNASFVYMIMAEKVEMYEYLVLYFHKIITMFIKIKKSIEIYVND